MQQNYDVVHTLDQSPARNSCLAGNTIARCLNCSSVLNNSSSSCSDAFVGNGTVNLAAPGTYVLMYAVPDYAITTASTTSALKMEALW